MRRSQQSQEIHEWLINLQIDSKNNSFPFGKWISIDFLFNKIKQDSPMNKVTKRSLKRYLSFIIDNEQFSFGVKKRKASK